MSYKPKWAFDLFCEGAAAEIIISFSNDGDFELGKLERLWLQIQRIVLCNLFGWFWWEN